MQLYGPGLQGGWGLDKTFTQVTELGGKEWGLRVTVSEEGN